MAQEPVVKIDALLALNLEYVQALWNGEPWALKHMRLCLSLNAGEPEGFRRDFDGTPHKWCGAACPHDEGCIMCTLPENPEMAKANRARKQQQKPMLLAEQGVITILGPVNYELVAQVEKMLNIARRHQASELEVRIESQGGDVRAGLRIYDLIREAVVTRRVGVVPHYALSMATIILQACDQRVASPQAKLLHHQTRFSEVTFDMLKDRRWVDWTVALSESDEDRMGSILVSRTGRTLEEIRVVSAKDEVMTSQEALEFGLIDAICK